MVDKISLTNSVTIDRTTDGKYYAAFCGGTKEEAEKLRQEILLDHEKVTSPANLSHFSRMEYKNKILRLTNTMLEDKIIHNRLLDQTRKLEEMASEQSELLNKYSKENERLQGIIVKLEEDDE